MLGARRCQGNQTYARRTDGRTDGHTTARAAAIDANKGRRTWPRERIPDF